MLTLIKTFERWETSWVVFLDVTNAFDTEHKTAVQDDPARNKSKSYQPCPVLLFGQNFGHKAWELTFDGTLWLTYHCFQRETYHLRRFYRFVYVDPERETVRSRLPWSAKVDFVGVVLDKKK